MGARKNILTSFVIAVGVMGIRSECLNSTGETSAKSVEQYWVETGLNTGHLLSVLSRENCSASKRQFLACANAVSVLASRVQKHVLPTGEIAAGLGENTGSEVERLKTWGGIEPLSTSFSFVQIAAELVADLQPQQKPGALGVALNAYLSVAEDPHSYLVPKRYFQEVVSKSDHRSKSLGFIVAKKGDGLIIKKIVPGSPMEKAGALVGDQIVNLDGQKIDGSQIARLPEIIKSRQQKSNDIAIVLRRGTEVLDIKIAMQDFTYSTVNTKIISESPKVALMAISKFSKGLCEKVKSEIQSLQKQEIAGLILDLRDNSGGQMVEASCVASLFVGADKEIFSIRYFENEGPEEVYFGKEEKLYSKPLAILINDGSASAAEILAGSLQEYNRATVVGSRSFGKGSFQEPEELEGFEGLYHFRTKGFYYLPSGRSPQLTGIIPQVEIPVTYDDADHEGSLYLFPLRAPVKGLDSASAAVSEGSSELLLAANQAPGKCNLGTTQALTGTPDLEVERAAQVLQCEHR
ncbi:MAG: S41 family peptidase [Bdellovibrionota bacterium]